MFKGWFWVYAWTFDTTGNDEDTIRNVSNCYFENMNWKDPKYELSWDIMVSSGNQAFEGYDRIGYKYYNKPLFSIKFEDSFNENT